jgi:predicted esterase
VCESMCISAVSIHTYIHTYMYVYVQMPSWFDLFGLSEKDQEDVEGMCSSAAYLSSLVQKEIENGIPPERIVVAGFSQGMYTHVCMCVYTHCVCVCE